MPTNRRRRLQARRPDVAELTKWQRRHLESGHPLFRDAGFRDLETFTAAWELHREEILRDFIAKYPGHRPFAWWVLDHRQERPIVNPGPLAAACIAEERRRTFGFLHTSILIPAPGPTFIPFQEPETAYLARKNVLTKAERAALNL